MKNILWFTDPHLGVRRSSHTSAKSQLLFQQHLFDLSMDIVTDIAAKHEAVSFCAGDLFDRFANPESIIAQGIEVAKKCVAVLEGNHDRKNNTEVVGSLDLVAQAGAEIVRNEEPSKPFFKAMTVGNKVTLFFIPHCFTQSIFEQSIKFAIQQFTPAQKKAKRVLVLHCNSKPWNGEVQLEGCTLGLTEELTDLIVKHFDLCLLGHEHIPQSLRGGKIRVLGNIFPLGFGEIADRFVYVMDLDTLAMKPIKVFDAKEGACQINVDELLNFNGEMNVGQGLVEIVGEIRSEDYPQLSRALMTFWKANDGSLLAVKNSVVVLKSATASPSKQAISSRSLPEVVEEEVGKTDLADTYREVSNSLKNEE